jgi:hypothetical protein
MAKFIIEYDVNVGDRVEVPFQGNVFEGFVQDVTQMPDVFVEFVDYSGVYRRIRVGVDSLTGIDKSFESSRVEIVDDEYVEMLHGGNLGEDGFEDLSFTTYREFKEFCKGKFQERLVGGVDEVQ